MKIDYLLAFVLRGKTRKRVFLEISQGRKAPPEIYHSTKIARTHIRRAILELEEKSLLKCLNPNDKVYKLYVPTDSGKKVKKLLDET